MLQYQVFRQEVESALISLIEDDTFSAQKIHRLLNGAAANALDASFTRSERRNDGIFFSSHALSQQVAALLATQIRSGSSIADPTCGAGDLLLGCMTLAPLGANIKETIKQWSKNVMGLDIHPEFVATTKARLALLAADMHRGRQPLESVRTKFDKAFANVQHADFFEAAKHIANADCVVMNPPFYETDALANCSWGNGKMQIAAQFVAHVLALAKPNQEIVAVLPDVLRSGSRYSRWRSQVEQRATVLSKHVYGRFDKKTDVDVFIIHLRKLDAITDLKHTTMTEWNLDADEVTVNLNQSILQNLFHVSVGAVVPHRHKNIGEWFPYLCVKTAPPKKEITVIRKKRTIGSVHQAPFVAIRRTSSPGDPRRIVATLVRGTEQIAVENHLIVIKPIDAKLSTCRKLMNLLEQDYVDDWINHAIRCRHLTTTAIKRIPLVDW